MPDLDGASELPCGARELCRFGRCSYPRTAERAFAAAGSWRRRQGSWPLFAGSSRLTRGQRCFSGRFLSPTPSIRLDKILSYLRLGILLVSTCSCAPRVFRRASQGPQGRVVPFGGAREGPDRRFVGYVLQSSSADRAESLARFIGAYHHRRLTVPLCLGVRGPGIAELCSVASRVACSVVKPNNLIAPRSPA